MVTVTLNVDDCAYWQCQIRDAIRQVPGAEYAVVQVYDEDDEVVVAGVDAASANKLVVAGVDAASANKLATQIYVKVGLRACLVNIVDEEEKEGLRVTVEDDEEEDEEEEDEEDNEEDEEEDVEDDDEAEEEEDDEDEEEDDEAEDDGNDEDDEDDEAEDDDDTYVQLSSLSINPVTAIREPWWGDQPVAQPVLRRPTRRSH